MPRYPRVGSAGLIVFLSVGTVACDESRIPTAYTPPASPQPPSQPTVSLSGVVFDHTSNGTRPGANIRLVVHAWTTNGHTFQEVTSDQTGRYSLSGVPAGAISIAAALGSGYYAPCPSGWDVVRSDRVFDVHVATATQLSTTGADIPTSGSIWVSGVVFERTANGIQPVAGATVNLAGENSDSRIGSNTVTDAAGRYLVCPPLPGTGTDQSAPLRVSRDGYRTATANAFLGWDYAGFDIELSRD